MQFRDRAEVLAELIEEAQRRSEDLGQVPTHALRALRGDMPAYQVALKAGLTPAELSRFENGDRPLTPGAARKLAPVLGVTEEELWTVEEVSTIRRAALKGELDPQKLLDQIMDLAYSLPDEDLAENITDSLLSILGEALEKHREDARERGVALKSEAEGPRPDRDPSGRRRNKPFGLPEGR